MATPQPNLQRLGEAAVKSLERQDWLEPLADRLQRAVVAAYRWRRDRPANSRFSPWDLARTSPPSCPD
jgi:hypothetical protein